VWMAFFIKQPVHFQYGVFFAIFGVPLSLWFGLCALQINHSIRRYNERGKPRTA
jgi:hypothetical protein